MPGHKANMDAKRRWSRNGRGSGEAIPLTVVQTVSDGTDDDLSPKHNQHQDANHSK